MIHITNQSSKDNHVRLVVLPLVFRPLELLLVQLLVDHARDVGAAPARLPPFSRSLTQLRLAHLYIQRPLVSPSAPFVEVVDIPGAVKQIYMFKKCRYQYGGYRLC
mgnify:CR=1 FL=1